MKKKGRRMEVPASEVPAQNSKERQQTIIFLEQTAALAAAMILILALLELLDVFQDENAYPLLFVLGAFMNLLGALRDHYRGYRFLKWMETAGIVLCAAAAVYLLLF